MGEGLGLRNATVTSCLDRRGDCSSGGEEASLADTAPPYQLGADKTDGPFPWGHQDGCRGDRHHVCRPPGSALRYMAGEDPHRPVPPGYASNSWLARPGLVFSGSRTNQGVLSPPPSTWVARGAGCGQSPTGPARGT